MAGSQRQIHVSSGTRIQTLATRASEGGLTILSAFSGEPALTEIHVPVAALSWLANEVRKASDPRDLAVAAAQAASSACRPPIVPHIDEIRAEAHAGGRQAGDAAA